MGTVVIYDAESGETVERDETLAEIADREARAAEAAEQEANKPYSISKLALWTRLTDEEAETVDAAMADQPARLRGIWNSATEVRSDSEFFATLTAFLSAVLGDERATQVLQPE